jgi:prevent-host-death family protein
MSSQENHVIAAGKFKAECLKEIDHVQQTGESLIVTKRGKPIVKIIPIINPNEGSFFGCMKDTLTISGDITLPIEQSWNSDEGNL